MDNLYNNVKLFRNEYEEGKMLHGVARTHGRGVPEGKYLAGSEEQNKTGRNEGRSKSGNDER